MNNPLAEKIRARIAKTGPICVADFMDMALADPDHGYYRTHDPLGERGDFVTAPEVSQMFGEIVGVWTAHMWGALGAPSPFALIELGPGRGTLMADLLRAARAVPGFAEATSAHLVETSPVLRERQGALITPFAPDATWHDALDTVPQGPSVIIANEFFDALPIRQFIKGEAGWHERLVDMDDEGRFTWTQGETIERDAVAPELSDAAPGAIVETSPASAALARQIAERLTAAPGCALFIDYGYEGPAVGDTFQAVRAHNHADPLADPGEADLTAHVDFAALADAAHAAGAQCYGPIGQARFLSELGIGLRADRLISAQPDRAGEIEVALARLTSPDQMGALFKAVAITSPGIAPPPPFPPASTD